MADYFLRSGAAGAGTGASWTDAYTTLNALLTRTAPTFNNGDRIWVADDHTETVGTNTTYDFKGVGGTYSFIYVVDHTVASPGLADLRIGTVSGGSIIGSGTTQLIFNGFFYMYGLYMSVGSGSSGANLAMSNVGSAIYDNCKLVMAATAGGNMLLSGGANSTIYQDCVFKGNWNGVNINCRGGVHLIRCTWDVSVASPQSVIQGNAASTRLLAEDCDWSNLTGVTNIVSGPGGLWYSAIFRRCKLPSSGVPCATLNAALELQDIEFIQCDFGGALYRNEKYTGPGIQTTNTVVARANGATDYGTAISQKVVTSVSAKYPVCIRLNPYVIWNAVTGSAVSITVEGIADPRDFTALPNNDEVAIEVEYLGVSGSPLGIKFDGQKVSPLSTAAALSASTQDWTAGTAITRPNSTSMTLNTIFKVASKPGMLFIVTTAGATAASEPAGYASAVDGTTGIVDNVMRAAAFWRFKQTLTTTGSGGSPHPQSAGYIYVTPKVFKTSSLNGVFFDPLPLLS